MTHHRNIFKLWPGLAGLLILLSLIFLSGLSTGGVWAQGDNYSLRFYGHGANAPDLDRVKIKIDNPTVPADIGAADFTLEWWMKANSGDNTSGNCIAGVDQWIYFNIMFDRDINGQGDFGDFGVSLAGNGRLAYGVSVGSNGAGLCSTSNVANGQWRHVAVTRRLSDGQMTIFVDGQLETQIDGPDGDASYRNGRTTSWPNSDPYLVIAAEKHDVGTDYPSFEGWIDEVRLSKTIRYSANFTRPSAPFSSDSNTVALYHFNEGPAGACTGTVLDSSGASGGPSNGVCKYGGSSPTGPVYSTDTPPLSGGTLPTATPTFTPTPTRTPTPTTTPDTTPPTISNIDAAPLDTKVTISWDTNEPATSIVSYGLSSPPCTSTGETSSYVINHQVPITGLSQSTTYFYRVRSRDQAGNLSSCSPIREFTTISEAAVDWTYLPVILK
jgi:hypothetical protein